MANNIERFIDCVNEIFGVYLDSVFGFDLNLKFIEQQQQVAQQLTKLLIEELDRASIIRGKGHPSSGIEMHRMTQGEFKKNNARGGLNHRKALEYCLSDLFNR